MLSEEIWPSTYWATKEDSINVRWSSGELSPAEKYDKAFNGWVPEDGFMALRPYREGPNCKDFDPEYYDKLGPLATHVVENMGNRKARDGVDSDGDGEVDECGDRDGVESWWGLCHAGPCGNARRSTSSTAFSTTGSPFIRVT